MITDQLCFELVRSEVKIRVTFSHDELPGVTIGSKSMYKTKYNGVMRMTIGLERSSWLEISNLPRQLVLLHCSAIIILVVLYNCHPVYRCFFIRSLYRSLIEQSDCTFWRRLEGLCKLTSPSKSSQVARFFAQINIDIQMVMSRCSGMILEAGDISYNCPHPRRS